MNYTNWFVLGTIGWAYLVACIVYALSGRRIAGVAACTGLLVLLWIADHEGMIRKVHFLNSVGRVVSFRNIAANASITFPSYDDGPMNLSYSASGKGLRRSRFCEVLDKLERQHCLPRPSKPFWMRE